MNSLVCEHKDVALVCVCERGEFPGFGLNSLAACD
jgi:hypothetical protein